MAVTKKHFITADLEGTYNWFKANASDYFDDFEFSDSLQHLKCRVGNLYGALDIFYDSNSRIGITIKTELGYSTTIRPAGNHNTGTYGYIRRLTKTDFGIAIAVYAEPSIQGNPSKVTAIDGLYITKDVNGNTAFVWFSRLATGREFGSQDSTYNVYDKIYSINIKSGTASLAFGADKSSDFGIAKKDYTQLFPVGIDEQDTNHLPNLMGAVYSQLVGTECTLLYNNDKYLFNGYIALKV